MSRPWILALLLAGCTTTGGSEFGVGVGREFRDGSLAISDSFSEQPGGEATDFSFEQTEDDVDSLNVWYVWKFAPPTARVEPVYIPAPPPTPTDDEKTPPNNNIKVLGMEIPTDTNPILVLAVAALVIAVGVFGTKRVKQHIAKKKSG